MLLPDDKDLAALSDQIAGLFVRLMAGEMILDGFSYIQKWPS